MTVAITISLISFVAAVASGVIAARSRRASERFRVASERRSRLEVATGSLQLELFLESRSFARRLEHYFRESGEERLQTYRDHGRPGSYHRGGMMIYRILRPLTVGEIIEKQTLAGDLLLDPGMMDMIRFSQAAVEMLTGDKLGRAFEDEGFFKGFDMAHCWDSDGDDRERPAVFQRIRGSYLRCGAAALVAESKRELEPRRCLTHSEFCKLWERPDPGSKHAVAFNQGLEPMRATLHGFSRYQNPILWLRLVGYAFVCERFFEQMWDLMVPKRFRQRLRHPLQKPVEFKPLDVKAVKMLEDLAPDEDAPELNRYVARHAQDYVKRFGQIFEGAL
ncbi:MAG TPA: hypothetical protein VFS64_10815 [Solirubrobacterales bacterium]|nr:hypothetical protein [Solirubrobacterales bacterium]